MANPDAALPRRQRTPPRGAPGDDLRKHAKRNGLCKGVRKTRHRTVLRDGDAPRPDVRLDGFSKDLDAPGIARGLSPKPAQLPGRLSSQGLDGPFGRIPEVVLRWWHSGPSRIPACIHCALPAKTQQRNQADHPERAPTAWLLPGTNRSRSSFPSAVRR